jgi:hypothetical protein
VTPGVLYGHLNDGFLDPGTEEVQSSVSVLISSFQSYSPFTINPTDDAAGIPGLLVGRYLNDVYNGGNSSQPGGGNPWILCTASLAEIFYRAAQIHAERGSIAITPLNQRFFQQAFNLSAFGRHDGGYETGVLDEDLMASIVPGNTISAANDRKLFQSYMNMLTLTGAFSRDFPSKAVYGVDHWGMWIAMTLLCGQAMAFCCASSTTSNR